jgi:DNA topoisomerase-1
VPPDIAPDELTVEVAHDLLTRTSEARTLGTHPETGLEIVLREGRYGPYVTEVVEDGKPRTASLLASMSPETVTLEDVLPLLELPRDLGEGVTAQLGRYGPYIQQGKETRSLEREEQVFTITLEEALDLLAQPKQRRRRAQAAAAPLKELGADPTTEKPIVVKEGRFGPYVTDGETNASLRKGDDPATVTLDRALELLAERRAKGPPAKRRTSRRRS